jgi:hypothetical protein
MHEARAIRALARERKSGSSVTLKSKPSERRFGDDKKRAALSFFFPTRRCRDVGDL